MYAKNHSFCFRLKIISLCFIGKRNIIGYFYYHKLATEDPPTSTFEKHAHAQREQKKTQNSELKMWKKNLTATFFNKFGNTSIYLFANKGFILFLLQEMLSKTSDFLLTKDFLILFIEEK